MKACRIVEEWLHLLLKATLDRGELQARASSTLPRDKDRGNRYGLFGEERNFCPLWNRAMIHRTSSPPNPLSNHVCGYADVQMATLYIAKPKYAVLQFHFLSSFPTVSSSTRPCVILHNKLCFVVGNCSPRAQRLHWRTISSQLSGIPITYT